MGGLRTDVECERRIEREINPQWKNSKPRRSAKTRSSRSIDKGNKHLQQNPGKISQKASLRLSEESAPNTSRSLFFESNEFRLPIRIELRCDLLDLGIWAAGSAAHGLASY
jgi:hypothetical protein